jgi:hypothetical protein
VDETPPVAARLEGEAQHPERAGPSDPAVGCDRPEREPWRAAGADHELAQAVDRVGPAKRVLEAEPLVVVVMAVEDQLGPAL